MSNRRGEGPVLIDPTLDRRLDRDGFVKVRVISEDAAADLRSRYGQVHGWSGDGFEVDFWQSEPGYRHRASAVIAEVLDEPLRALFAGYEPFLRNFLVKWPGLRDPDGFPEGAHRDWMYTDERAGTRSYVAWVALEDIDGHNGQLKVARASHRIDDRLRGTNIDTPWLGDSDFWAHRLQAVPVKAGEAVITNAATVHGSHFNLTDGPRVAVAVAMAPAGAQLMHYWGASETEAKSFAVDPSWFLDQPAPQLLETPPDLPMAGVVPIGGSSRSRRSLAWSLDRHPVAFFEQLNRRWRRLRHAS